MTGERARRPRGMGLRVTVSQTTLRRPVSRGLSRWLAQAGPARARGEVGVAIVSDAHMRRLNREFRSVDRVTDVLSFPAAEPTPGTSQRHRTADVHLGDIAIAVGVARRQAAEQGHSLEVELRILALHGLLHLLGYDHERDDGAMRRTEERLRRRAGLPGGLIARTAESTLLT